MTLTGTVRLEPAPKENDDFELLVCLKSSTGNAVSVANERPVKDLRIVLGKYLFAALKASN